MYSPKDAKEKLPAIAVSVQNNVDAEKIGIIGIYSWGGMALNVAILKRKCSWLVVYSKKRSTSN